MIESNRFVASTKNVSDSEIEQSLRPININDYVGQNKVKENLEIYIKAAKKRGEALDHVLLYGSLVLFTRRTLTIPLSIVKIELIT